MTVKQARRRIESWNPRGSNCPICHKDFRHGCNHNVVQSEQRLQEDLIDALVERKVKKILKYENQVGV